MKEKEGTPMLEYSKNQPLHDAIVDSIQRKYAGYIGRQLLDAYNIANLRPSIVTYDTPLLGTKRPDLVAILLTGLGMHMTSIIEVKRTTNDLFDCGPQLSEYLGTTACFFVAVPSDILGDCICKVQDPKCLRLYKGIINADNGDIVVLPRLQNHLFFKENKLIYNISQDLRYQPDATGLYGFHDVPLRASKPTFTEIDGMLVRNKYADLFLKEANAGYPAVKAYYNSMKSKK